MGGLEAIMKASVELVSSLPMSRAIDCKRGEQDRADLGIDTEVAERQNFTDIEFIFNVKMGM